MVRMVRISLLCWLCAMLVIGIVLGGPGGLQGAAHEGRLVFDRGQERWRSNTLLTPWNPFEPQRGERTHSTRS